MSCAPRCACSDVSRQGEISGGSSWPLRGRQPRPRGHEPRAPRLPRAFGPYRLRESAAVCKNGANDDAEPATTLASSFLFLATISLFLTYRPGASTAQAAVTLPSHHRFTGAWRCSPAGGVCASTVSITSGTSPRRAVPPRLLATNDGDSRRESGSEGSEAAPKGFIAWQ